MEEQQRRDPFFFRQEMEILCTTRNYREALSVVKHMYTILQSDFASDPFYWGVCSGDIFLDVRKALWANQQCVSKLFKSRPGHAIPVITIDSPPSCSLVHRVHYTELDVTQIRAHVRPHTALLLSYLCKAPLRGGSIAEVWSFISSVWLHRHQDTSGTLR